MTRDVCTGLVLNIPVLQAEQSLMSILEMCTLFAGKDGKDYMDHLTHAAWPDSQDDPKIALELFDIGEQRRKE